MTNSYIAPTDQYPNAVAGQGSYADLPPTGRRSHHRAAAASRSGAAAWSHQVAAAGRADESLAASLELAARHATPPDLGDPGPAQLLEWASALSEDSENRERRLLMAAIYRAISGDLGPPELWVRARACAPSALRSCALAGQAILEGQRLEADFQLNQAIAQDIDLNAGIAALKFGLTAALNANAALGEQATRAAIAGLAIAPDDGVLRRWLVLLLATGASYADGPRAALDILHQRATHQPTADDRRRPADGQLADPATVLAAGSYQVLSGQPREAIADLSRLTGLTDAGWPADWEAQSSFWLALGCHLTGAWRRAAEHARVAVGAAGRPGARIGGAPDALCCLLAAHRGDWNAACEHLRRARERHDAERPDDPVLADFASLALTHARGENLLGQPALARLAGAGGAARKYRSLWLPLQAEAQVEAGSERAATTTLSELRELAEQVPYLRVAYCRLAGRFQERRRDPQDAARHYLAMQELPPEALVVPFQIGLLEHCYGRLLGRLGDVEEGRSWLNRGRVRLTFAGALSYASRCGPDPAGRRPAAGDGPASVLTEREHAVASLVAAGMTNQEAAAHLYVGVKTIEYHLTQIYGKLGITSRRQLTRPGSGDALLHAD
jgi:DNA-binding CsgD family transcriptional regulator